MPPLAPHRPTPLTADQLARLRAFNLRVLATSTSLYLAWIAVALIDLLAPTNPIRQWWLLPPVIGAYAVMYFLLRRLQRTFGVARKKPLIPPYPHSLLTNGAFISFGALVGGLAFQLFAGGGTDTFIFILVPVFTLGITLLGASNLSFVITPPSCQKCRYPLEGMTFPAACPECAHTAEKRSDAVTFHKVRKPQLKAAGIACFLVVLIPILMPPGIPSVVAARLPAGAQLALAPTEVTAFNEVIQRGLTPDEHRRLADALLDIRNGEDTWGSNTQLEWLSAEHAAGRLTPEQSERFATDGYRFEIITNTPPRVGQPMMISLSGNAPRSYSHDSMLLYATPGFDLNTHLPLADPGKFYGAHSLDNEWRDRTDPNTGANFFNPIVTHTPEAPGPLTVRARIIAITFTGAPPMPTITWHDDNTYTITPLPLTTHEFTAETTLQVEP